MTKVPIYWNKAKLHLSKKDKVFIFNADQESRKHLKKSLSLQKKLIHVFGNKITENKKISIDLLAQEAFSNETNHKILNGIMWPEILILINRAYENAKKNKFKLFIVDAALIFEANFTSFFDKVILISTKKSTRIDRAIKR